MDAIEQWEIPTNWKWVQISELGKIVAGGTPSTKESSYWGDEINWITPADLSGYNDKFILKGAKSLSKKGLEKSSAQLMPSGSIHFSSRAPIGYVVISKEEISTNQGFKSLVPANEIFNEYVYYYFKSAKQLAEKRASGTTFKEISKKSFSLLPIPIAPYNEQRVIVYKIEQLFSDLDNGIDNFKKAQEQLKRYRQSVLKAACEGKLVPTEAELARAEGRDYEPADVLLARILKKRREKWNGKGKYKEPAAPDTTELPELPEGWRWTNMESTGVVSGGLTKNSKRNKLFQQMPYIRVANVYADKLKLEDISNIGIKESEIERVLLEKGDLLVVEGNGSLDQIGRAALWDGSISPCVHQNHIIKVRFNPTKIGKYILLWLLSKKGRKEITNVASSTSGLYTLGISKVASLFVPLPPLAEQHRIITEVERRLSICDKMEETITESLQKAESLRQSILKKAFEGKLLNEKELEEARNAPDWEPAEKLLERIRQEKQIKENSNKPTRRKTHG